MTVTWNEIKPILKGIKIDAAPEKWEDLGQGTFTACIEPERNALTVLAFGGLQNAGRRTVLIGMKTDACKWYWLETADMETDVTFPPPAEKTLKDAKHSLVSQGKRATSARQYKRFCTLEERDLEFLINTEDSLEKSPAPATVSYHPTCAASIGNRF